MNSCQESTDKQSSGVTVVTIFGKHDTSFSSRAISAVASETSLDPFHIGEVLSDATLKNRTINDDSKQPLIEAVYVAEKKTLVITLGLPASLFQLYASSTGRQRTNEIAAFRLLTILLTLSHIAVLVESGATFSLRYATIFKAVFQSCHKTSSIRTDVMKKLKLFPNGVVSQGRLGAPRLLLVFDCRRIKFNNEGVAKKIRELRHSLEDQTYRIMRQSHTVHATSTQKSLVSIPSNEEFVAIIVDQQDGESMSANNLLLSMITDGMIKNNDNQPSKVNSWTRTRDFIYRHVEQMQKPDPGKPFVCSLNHWAQLFLAFEKALGNSQAIVRTMDRFLFVNATFAENLCKQALDAAKSAYSENLPRYYASSVHEERYQLAREIFAAKSRNCAQSGKYLQQLEDFCNDFYSLDRRLCEKMSIFGSLCTLPMHHLPGEEDNYNDGLPVRNHCCNALTIAACNCGRIQADRDDPFTSAEANHEFYEQLEKDCCGNLQHIPLMKFEKCTNIAKAQSSLHSTQRSENEPYSERTQSQLIEEYSTQNDDNEVATTSSVSLSPQQVLKNEIPVPSFWSLVSLGNFTSYSLNRGLMELPGFANGSCYLTPIGVDSDGNTVTVVKQGSSSAGKGRGATMSPAIVGYVGVEFECPKGHRFLLESPEKAQRIPAGSQNSSPSIPSGRGGLLFSFGRSNCF